MATPVDIAVWCAKAGWRGTDLVNAVAVSLASGGSAGKPGGLFGLGNTGDPQSQCNQAYATWKQSGWGPFKAHNSKAYLLHVPIATAAVATGAVKVIVDDPGGALDAVAEGVKDTASKLPVGDVVDAAKAGLTLAFKAGAWMANPDNWSRVIMVVIGGGMVVGGLALAVGKTATAPLTAVAGSLGPVGKIAAAGGKQ